MAFPAIINVILGVVLVVIGVPVVWLLSKTLRLRPNPVVIAEPRREAARASMVVLALLAWRALFVVLFFYSSGIANFVGKVFPSLSAELTFLLWWSVLNGISLLIIAVAMKITGQTLGSIGVNRHDLGKVVGLGLASSSVLVAITGLLAVLGGGGFAGLSYTLVVGFVLYAIVGYSEETVWRGYVQTRLVAYAGTMKGVLVTSLIFGTLYHFPVAYYFEASQTVVQALAWASLRVFGGIVFGYTMVKSQNVIASSTLHLFYDWTSVLWR